ncbi:hypothetical protein [Streptomyces odontomachi]|uniref:hypothetical protein n=1 Tax=Streptomyces odontomachi TaxID=2944940 RepID=UPI00210BE808|nr:hypothetical protein [Streptomyces sp. ODS25]
MIRNLRASLGTVAGAGLLAGAVVMTTGAPAQAAALGCTYPYVCLYNASQTKVGQFQDVTTDWQSFTRTDVYYAVNTRNDDVAYFRYSNGLTNCVAEGKANTIWDLRSTYGPDVPPNGIRIATESDCYPGTSE